MKKLTNSVVALTLAGLGLVLTPGTASADFLDFTINPTVLEAGSGAGAPFQADRIVGGYAEAFTVTAFDGTNGAFVTDAYYNVGQFYINSEGLPTEIGVATHQEGLDYQLYALFTATGTFTNSATGDVEFTATGGSITVYVDQDLNTGLSFVPAIPAYNAATDSITRTNIGDDSILATATLLHGGGEFESGDANGDFSITFNPFVLQGLGVGYFAAPIPFYLELLLEGQFNTFVPALGTAPVITGSADASFNAVPEPVTLTLLGIGLMGSSLAARRRRKV